MDNSAYSCRRPGVRFWRTGGEGGAFPGGMHVLQTCATEWSETVAEV